MIGHDEGGEAPCFAHLFEEPQLAVGSRGVSPRVEVEAVTTRQHFIFDDRWRCAMGGIVATAEIDIDAPPERVWKALTDPAEVKDWMFGTDLVTDWRVGSPITWKGEYQGTTYEDKGEVVSYDEPRVLTVTHFSPTTGQPDVPENYHTVAFTLAADGDGTHLMLTQDNNGSDEEAARSAANWNQALEGIKARVER